jgi:NAD(P)-dependent dehydrogenase (short-subunit alcohol dehydrogenase family)
MIKDRMAGCTAMPRVYAGGAHFAKRERRQKRQLLAGSGKIRVKTVVVTGAGAGIGRALAVGFAGDGCRVVGIGRTRAALEETGALCQGQFSYLLADVADAEAVANAMERVAADGAIDALICNAAVYPREFFLHQPAVDWTSTLLTNVCGVANCCRAVLPAMLDRNAGRIVVIGSLADLSPLPGASAYSASKAALHSLVRALACEIDRRRYPNVLINEFNPPATRTAMCDIGASPSSLYRRVKQLVEFPAGGPTGRMYLRYREYRPNEGARAKLKRIFMSGLVPTLGRTSASPPITALMRICGMARAMLSGCPTDTEAN